MGEFTDKLNRLRELEERHGDFMRKYDPFYVLLKDRNKEPQKLTRPNDKLPQTDDPRILPLVRAIDERRNDYHLVGVEMCGKDIFNTLIEAFKTNGGGRVKVDVFMAFLGACAGTQSLKTVIECLPEKYSISDFACAETKDGSKHIFGDWLNGVLFEGVMIYGKDTVYGIISGTVENRAEFELKKLIERTVETLCTDEYYKPRLPENFAVEDSPRDIAVKMRNTFDKKMEVYCPFPYERPLAFAYAGQLAIESFKEQYSPLDLLKIFMAFALPVSHDLSILQ